MNDTHILCALKLCARKGEIVHLPITQGVSKRTYGHAGLGEVLFYICYKFPSRPSPRTFFWWRKRLGSRRY